MRVLLLTLRVPYPPTDGGAIAMAGLARGLRQAGHHVTVAALNTHKHRQHPGVLLDEGIANEVISTDIDTQPTALGALRSLVFERTPYNAQRFWSPTHARALQAAVLATHYDVIQLEGVYLAPYIPWLRKGKPAPIVLRAHNVEYEVWERLANNEPHPLKRLYYRHLARRGKTFERYWVPQFDGIAAITERDQAVFASWAPQVPSIHLPVGANLPELPPQEAADPRHIGWLGSLDWAPNLQGLIHFIRTAWPAVQAQVPGAVLHIAGKNPPQPTPPEFSLPGIMFHGEVPDAQAFLLKHPIVLVPLWAGGGMRVKVVESLALGRCVVATPIGAEGIPLIDGTHALLAQSPTDFARQVEKLVQDDEFRSRIRSQARNFAEQTYSWEALTQRLCAFYASLG